MSRIDRGLKAQVRRGRICPRQLNRDIVLNCTVRKAAASDADVLFSLVSEFATSFTPEREAFEVSLKQLLSDESARLSLAENDGEVIG